MYTVIYNTMSYTRDYNIPLWHLFRPLIRVEGANRQIVYRYSASFGLGLVLQSEFALRFFRVFLGIEHTIKFLQITQWGSKS